jgi:hypothetical protein
LANAQYDVERFRLRWLGMKCALRRLRRQSRGVAGHRQERNQKNQQHIDHRRNVDDRSNLSGTQLDRHALIDWRRVESSPLGMSRIR